MKTILMAAGTVVMLSGCSAVSQGLGAVGLAQSASDVAGRCSGVTMTNYNKIKIGMTLSQVESVLGCKGDELSTDGNGGTYSFTGVGDRYIGVITTNGKVVNKQKGNL